MTRTIAKGYPGAACRSWTRSLPTSGNRIPRAANRAAGSGRECGAPLHALTKSDREIPSGQSEYRPWDGTHPKDSSIFVVCRPIPHVGTVAECIGKTWKSDGWPTGVRKAAHDFREYAEEKSKVPKRLFRRNAVLNQWPCPKNASSVWCE